MQKLNNRDVITDSELKPIRWAKTDCIKLSLIEEVNQNNIRLTLTGEEFISNQISRPRVFRNLLLSLSYINEYLKEIEDTKKVHIEVLKKILGDTGYTEETWAWRSKILSNWLIFAGIIQRKAGKVVKTTQTDLFDNSFKNT